MKHIQIGIICVLALVMSACGGSSGGSKNKPKSSSSSVVSSVVASSAEATSSVVSSVEASSSSEASEASSSPASEESSSSQDTVSSASSSTEVVSSSSSSTEVVASSSSSSSETASSLSSSTSSEDASSVSSSASSEVASSSSSSSSSVDNLEVGVFIDSPVGGIHYETSPGGHSGKTTANGEYQYSPGDTVTFSIGDLVFPSVPAKGVVTPMDMAGTEDTTNQVVINIAALLQSLDTDGDPSNGITIDYEVAAVIAQAVDFDQPYANFAASTAVTNLVANSGSTTTTLVSDADAIAHLESSIKDVNRANLIGTWYITGEGGFHYVLFILDDQYYAAIDYDPSVNNGAALEYGSYSWNQETGVVTVDVEEKTASGLDNVPPMANGNTLKINGDTLTLEDADDTFVLTKLKSTESHPLKGGWVMDEDDVFVVFAFTDEHYLMGQWAEEADEVGQPGVEFGTYTYDINTRGVVVSTLADTNGQWGLSHPCAVLDHEDLNDLSCGPNGADIIQTFTVDGDTMVFVSEADTIANGGEEQLNYFDRVHDTYDGSIRLNLDITVTVTAYSRGEGINVYCGISGDDSEGEIEVGDVVEQYREIWKLSRDPERDSWAGTTPAQFNPATGSITINFQSPLAPVEADENYEDEWEESFTGTYHPGQNPAITGTLTRDRRIIFTPTEEEATCSATYSVVGALAQ